MRFSDDNLSDFYEQFKAHVASEEEQQKKLEKAVSDNSRLVEELNKSTQGLLDAWKTATGLVKFIKWLSTLAVAIAAIWALFTGGFSNG